MIAKNFYITREKQLLKHLNKTLTSFSPFLLKKYGNEFTKNIIIEARDDFKELIPRIPHYKTAAYQTIIIANAELIALVRAMKKNGKTVEDVFKIQAGIMKKKTSKIPSFIGKIWISKFAGYFLNKIAVKGTEEGWISKYVRGSKDDNFEVSIITEKCGLVEYLKSEGMTDYLKYCNFIDFIIFPSMNIGLRQPSTINAGKCVYCMKYNTKSETPEYLQKLYY